VRFVDLAAMAHPMGGASASAWSFGAALTSRPTSMPGYCGGLQVIKFSNPATTVRSEGLTGGSP
jgi:hypothetical protein